MGCMKKTKKQVIFIHGGDTFDSYDKYIASLKKTKLDFKRALSKGWKGTLPAKLGPALPRMPNSLNAKYLEWKIWFDKFIPHMNKEVVLGGNSLGAIFLAKYLSENRFPKKIKGILLVAPPFKGNDANDSLADFVLPKNMSRLAKYGDKVHLYHSADDRLVLASDFKRYMEVLPDAKVSLFKDRGHFLGNRFPEIVKDIKSLYK